MRVFLIGYPGEMGGANTEAWHTVKIWLRLGLDVHLIPTWHADAQWRARLDQLGCVTHEVNSEQIEQVRELAGCPAVGFCNDHFISVAPRLRALGCPLIWLNCMTFLFDHEQKFFSDHGPMDAMVYQSQFQRDELEPRLAQLGYDPASGHLIRGAFDCDEWPLNPRPHAKGEPFFVGRASRPDQDKWSSNTWPIYDRIQYADLRALMLGMDDSTHAKLGNPPNWAQCLRPLAIPARQFFAQLHCTLPVNGGARENWPRAGLEAMACGVPIVAQNLWGWREMIEHRVTGFLADDDFELAHYAAMLAHDETLRMEIILNARRRLVEDLANPDKIGASWQRLFEDVGKVQREAA